jgi:hypothetical protein
MQENGDGEERPLDGRLEAAIDGLTSALAVLDAVGVPLACAYVDLALSLCREELTRRGPGQT